MNIFDIKQNYDCFYNFKVGNTVEYNHQAFNIVGIHERSRKFVIRGHYYGHPDVTRVVYGYELKMLGLQGN